MSLPRSAEWHIQHCGRWEILYLVVSMVTITFNVTFVIMFSVGIFEVFLVTVVATIAAGIANWRGREWGKIQRWEAFSGRKSYY